MSEERQTQAIEIMEDKRQTDRKTPGVGGGGGESFKTNRLYFFKATLRLFDRIKLCAQVREY